MKVLQQINDIKNFRKYCNVCKERIKVKGYLKSLINDKSDILSIVPNEPNYYIIPICKDCLGKTKDITTISQWLKENNNE